MTNRTNVVHVLAAIHAERNQAASQNSTTSIKTGFDIYNLAIIST